MMKNDRFVALAAGAAGLAIASPVIGTAAAALAQNAAAPAGAGPATGADAASVALLVEQINARLAELPADATPAAIEAQIVFAIDQAQMPADVVAAALAQLEASNSGAAVLAALGNVKALQGRLAGGTGGTAGINDSNSLNFGPSVNGSGGGSSDYTPAV